MIRKRYFTISVFILAFAATTAVFGQAVSGNITGTIQDASGAVLPNANITITDLDRGTVFRTQSNQDGNYEQTHLLAGRYQVKIESSGLGAFTANATVEVNATTRLDAKLNPANVATTVNVTDATPLLTTDRAEIATTLTGAQVQQLPVLDRNVTNLLLVIPGTLLNQTFQIARSENPQGGIQVDANGQFFTANGFLLDGTENESSILGIAVVNPNVDSLQEFKISTSNYDAEFGSVSGALVQATTKSGTNQWHGSLFEYLRNNLTNATNPFTQINPPIRWNQFGGSVGFPIIKDKLFGFFDYQGTRQRNGGSILTTVPTAAERSGDLTALLGSYICADGTVSAGPCANPRMVPTTEGGSIPARAGMVFDPNTGNPDGSGREAYTVNGQPNIIPVAAPMQKLLQLIPLPNGSGIVNNFTTANVQRFDTDQYDGRVDYNWTSATHVFGRYTLAGYNNYSPAAFGDAGGGPTAFNFSGDSIDRNQSLALGLDHTFSPTLITDARFGFYRYRIRVQPNDAGTTPATDAGLPGLNTGSQATSGLPAFYINGNGGFNFGYALNVNGCNCPLKETENQFQWVNNWTKITGDHTIKFGVDIRRLQQQRIPSDTHRSGEINFNASETGDFGIDQLAGGSASTGSGLASYLLGLPATFGRYYTAYDYYPGLRETRLFFFGQDSWRVTPKLTLTYGLRWEDYLPQTAAKPGGAGSFDPSTGDVLVAGVGSVPRNLGVKAYNTLFEPRIGIAYQAAPKTVIRAGFGTSANPSGLGSVFGQGADYNPPITNAQFVNQSNIYFAPFNLLNGPPAPPEPPIGTTGRYPLPNGVAIIYFLDPLNSYRIPLVEFWNFTVERQLTNTTALQIAYVGNVGRHLYENLNRNQAVPGPGDVDPRRPFYNLYGLTQPLTQYCNCDTSNYNSLQTKFQKQFSRGLDFLFTYTWSKALDYASEGAGNSPANIYDPRADYGPASWDREHVITFTHDWDIPVGRNRYFKLGNNAIADEILGGWRLSGVHTWGTGLAFTPTVANAPLLNDPDFSQVRPDVIGNPSVPNPSASLWFNPAAYSEPQQPFRQGTSGRDTLRGPHQWESDLSLSKNLLLSERFKLELRADAFNVFNHVNLGNPNSQIDGSAPGQITYLQLPMRQMQFGLHLQF